MVQKPTKQPAAADQRNELMEVAREVAAAIRYHAEYKAAGKQGENRRLLANGIIAWANLVFTGLVIAQAFSDRFSFVVAGGGAAIFIAAYVLAAYILKGGKDL